MKTNWSLTWIFWIGFFGISFGQNYSTLRNGDWSASNVWNRQTICAAPSWGTVNDSNHPQVPPTSSSWPDCAVSVIINHQLTRTGQTTFSSTFKSLKINKNGKLNFSTNHLVVLTNNSYGGVEFIVDGGVLEVYDLEITNGAKLRIINGGQVIVRRNLSTGGNSSLIELDATSSLEVKNEFKLAGSNADVKISGTLSAKLLNTTGQNTNHLQLLPSSISKVESLSLLGSTKSTLEGKIEVTGSFLLDGSASATLSKTGTLNVIGVSTIKSSSPLILEGNAQLKGNLSASGSASIQANGNLLVGGNTNLEGSAAIRIPGFATFENNVNLSGGGTLLQVSGDGDVLIKGDLIKPQYPASITVQNKGSLVICNDRVNGNKAGAFPPTNFLNMNIAPSPAYYGGCRILPVEFASFDAKYLPSLRSGILSWSTAKEWENSHFEIERSVNGVESWSLLEKIEGAGYSDAVLDYLFTDTKLPAIGGGVFYRIKQVDFNGQFIYSSTQAIQVESVAGTSTWTAYPVPSRTGEAIQIQLLDAKSYQDEVIVVTLSDLSGRAESFQFSSPNELSQSLPQILASKNPGFHILRLQWGVMSQQLKLQIQ